MIKKYIIGLCFVAVLLPLAAWQGLNLKKIKLDKRYKAIYSCKSDENYWVNKQDDTTSIKEQVISHAGMRIVQEVLEQKKHQLKIDYLLTSYTRRDTTIMEGRVDTTSNKGQIPLIKNILFFSDTGSFLGTALQSKSPKLQTRDYNYFYTAAKQLVFGLHSNAQQQNTWQTERTDTVLTTGFQVVVSYPLVWNFVENVDTMGMECVRLKYQSPDVKYLAINSVMKALGIETYHKGFASINGWLIVDTKTGRIVRLEENGSFIGNMEVNTARENSLWPSVYKYKKQLILKSLIKKPRKKFLGIF